MGSRRVQSWAHCYFYDLPKAIEHKAIPMLFADNTSMLITSHNNIQFQGDLNIVFGQLNEWFKANLLSRNADKTYLIQFTNIILYNIYLLSIRSLQIWKQSQ